MLAGLPAKLSAAGVIQRKYAQRGVGPAHARGVLVFKVGIEIIGPERLAHLRDLAITTRLGGGAEVDVDIGPDRAAQ